MIITSTTSNAYGQSSRKKDTFIQDLMKDGIQCQMKLLCHHQMSLKRMGSTIVLKPKNSWFGAKKPTTCSSYRYFRSSFGILWIQSWLDRARQPTIRNCQFCEVRTSRFINFSTQNNLWLGHRYWNITGSYGLCLVGCPDKLFVRNRQGWKRGIIRCDTLALWYSYYRKRHFKISCSLLARIFNGGRYSITTQNHRSWMVDSKWAQNCQKYW